MAEKAARKRNKPNRLRKLYEALEDQVRTQLEVRRLAHKNAEARGDAAEGVWLDLLAQDLPHRYQVGKGIAIDADGRESDYIDVIIYDRQFTPRCSTSSISQQRAFTRCSKRSRPLTGRT
jgi:hypothetical protein